MRIFPERNFNLSLGMSTYEDWLHVLCECPNYADIRNLQAMGITFNGETYDVSGIITDTVRFERTRSLAKEVFYRRRSRQLAGRS